MVSSQSTIIDPVFDFATFVQNEAIKNETDMVPPQAKAVDHKEVLHTLLQEIRPIDFVSLIRPEAKELITEYQAIVDAYESGNKELHKKLNVPKANEETSRVLEIEVHLKNCKKSIKQKHYVVCIIIEILKLAKSSSWNLCKCYDYVYVYNGAYWKQLSKEDLKYFLGQAAIKMGYPPIEAMYHLFKDELLKQFIADAHLSVPAGNPDKILINLQNGTFEFTGSTWNLRPFDPEDFLTYQLPFGYDKLASCPKYVNYLNAVLPDADCRAILQEYSGFIFTKLNLEKCLVLTGSGSNGKSVFFNILTALLGKENTLTYSMGLFNHEYNRARLTNVLLNYSSEKGTDLNVETFKALISGEPLQAREPYGKPFEINNKVKFIMNCNELPKETESTDAYFRRYIIIPFDVKISEAERDINLASDIIKSELPGVFNWLLNGLERLIRQKDFTVASKATTALANFKKQSDSIALFIEECNYSPSTNIKIPLADIYTLYKTFCLDDGYKPFGKNRFSSILESKGFEATRSNDGSKSFFISK